MSAQSGTTYGDRYIFTVAGIAVYAGTGSPEGVVSAYVGDFYFRKDGGAVSPMEPLYTKVSGMGTATGWQALATTAIGTTTPDLYIYDTMAMGWDEAINRAGHAESERVSLGFTEAFSKVVT